MYGYFIVLVNILAQQHYPSNIYHQANYIIIIGSALAMQRLMMRRPMYILGPYANMMSTHY